MRLVSYNILDGGEGRADPLAEVVLAQRPDIVVVIEADCEATLHRLSRRLGMDFAVGHGDSHAAAVFSRWPIACSMNHSVFHRASGKSLLEVEVTGPDGSPWHVAAVHLHARATEADERVREEQLGHVLDRFARFRRDGVRHILAGDFNANSPLQQIDPALCKPATGRAWIANGGGLPRRVISRILEHGYIDALAVANPTLAATGCTFTTQFPGQRVDYIFAWGIPEGSVRSAWIETDRLATYASDHYPIGAEFA